MKINTVITFNDFNIGILLFNNENIILFQDKVKLEKNIISNGMINNIKKVVEIVKKLVAESEQFVSTKITDVFVSFDISQIEIKQFNLDNIRLPNGVFNQFQWDLIKRSIKVDESVNKHIYDIVYNSWTIDNKKQNFTETQMVGEILDVEANMFLINKVIYNQYKIIFEKLDINVSHLKPLLNDFVNLSSSIKSNHYELYTYLNNDNIVICLTEGKKIIKCVNDNSLSLNKLYELIKKETNIELDNVEEILNNIWSYFGNFQNMKMINDLSDKKLAATTVNSDKVNEIISLFIKSFVELVEKNVEYLKTNVKINVQKVNYMSFNKFTTQMFNQINIYSKINSAIPNNSYLEENGQEFMQEWLIMQTVINESSINNINYNLEKKSMKIFKEINKG
ncbi:MAG: hypothetical protein ACRC4L_00700 [Mycoplasma sp.]